MSDSMPVQKSGSLQGLARRLNFCAKMALVFGLMDIFRIATLTEPNKHWLVVFSAFMLPVWTVIFVLEVQRPPTSEFTDAESARRGVR